MSMSAINILVPSSAPVLLVGFNRPDTMQRVFDAVRTVKPEKLYYAVDGARKGRNEEDRVQQVRDIVKQVDWSCEVHTLFREENVGCGLGPAGAITWAFENEDRLIILEDDCVPDPSFFRFCNELLERYKDDKRVYRISGLSPHPETKFFGEYDYLFSRYAHTWGWATWKSRWEEFDIDMSDVPFFLSDGSVQNAYDRPAQARRASKNLRRKYDNIEKEKKHSWDTQWGYACAKNGSINIVPRFNLITNVGDGNGTHTRNVWFANTHMMMPTKPMPEVIRHPVFMLRNKAYDNYHYTHHIHRPLVERALRKALTVFYSLVHKKK